MVEHLFVSEPAISTENEARRVQGAEFTFQQMSTAEHAATKLFGQKGRSENKKPAQLVTHW
jgi:hypothetical protein